jgi:phosphoribosyl-AMP cyclohydrolase
VSTETTNDLEEGVVLRPRFDASGLITCVTSDAATGDVLMVAHMNAEALRKTVESGEAWYFSRSRQALWRKGETSGHVQRVLDIRIDWYGCGSSRRAARPATPAGGHVSIVLWSAVRQGLP